MKRILYGIGTMNIGGTEKHLVQILNTINKNKYNVSLFLLYKNGVYLTQIPQNIKVYKVPKFLEKSGKLSVLFQTIRLFFILIKSKFDLLHFYLPHMYVVGGVLSFLLRKKFIMSRRSLNNYQKSNMFFRIIEPILHKKVVSVMVNSRAIEQQLTEKEKVKKEKIHLIYNGVLSSKKRNKRQNKILNLVCVANFIKYKRHEDLIKSCVMLTKNNWCLKLVGNGSKKRKEELTLLINKHKLQSKIKLLCNITDPSKILQESHIGLLCSEEEGFSNSILEYMSFGLPVIASKVGGNCECVIHGKNGYLFDVGNTKQICKFITELLTNKKLREIMGKNSWNTQQMNFTLSKQISDYESVYNKILEN